MQSIAAQQVCVRAVAQQATRVRRAAAAAPVSRRAAAVRSSFAGNTAGFAARAVSVKCRATRSVTVMKGGDPVSSGYAAALAETAKAAGQLEAVHSDAETLAAYMKANASIAAFLSNPVIDEKKKKEVISKIARESSFTPIFTNFLNLLVDKKRIALAGSIVEEFEAIFCELTDTQVATVTSAVKLENEQQFQIAKKLQELTGAKNIKLKPEVDASLLGGFVVQFGKDGSGCIDMSIKGQLSRLTSQLGSLKMA